MISKNSIRIEESNVFFRGNNQKYCRNFRSGLQNFCLTEERKPFEKCPFTF